MPLTHFTLTRASDGRVYSFSAQGNRHGKLAYRRSDGDFWVAWHPSWGWCALDSAGNPMGLSFSTPRSLQNGRPPQGAWVSLKAERSYVYDLRWGAERQPDPLGQKETVARTLPQGRTPQC